MRMTAVFRTAFAAGLIAGTALPANAQIYEIVGTRAQGMGGAFVAVADDATATWWNPAGLATGAYFSSVVELGRTTEPVLCALLYPGVLGLFSILSRIDERMENAYAEFPRVLAVRTWRQRRYVALIDANLQFDHL